MYFLPLFIYGLFSDAVDGPDHTHHRMVGWLVCINLQSMFKNAVISSLQFATPWSRAKKLVFVHVYKTFSALHVLL
jgi:hypothetical protein